MNFQLFKDVHESIKYDMGVVKASPYLDVQLLGYAYDVTSGTVEEVKICYQTAFLGTISLAPKLPEHIHQTNC